MSTTVRDLTRLAVGITAVAALLLTTGCASRHPVSAPVAPTAARAGRAVANEQEGYATYVARSFHGKRSASGEIFDEGQLVAAHRTLPFGSIVRVTNVQNGRSATVRIVDRGPYGQNYREGTIIDLSRAAARRLRMLRDGQVQARVEVLKLGDER
jgi:rare lipoprotein A